MFSMKTLNFIVTGTSTGIMFFSRKLKLKRNTQTKTNFLFILISGEKIQNLIITIKL